MDLADPEAALEKLREFREMLRSDYGNWVSDRDRDWMLEPVREMQPLIQGIATKVDPERVDALDEDFVSDAWGWHSAQAETSRLIGLLENREVRDEILGPPGPTLAANRLHPWVWNAVASLWGDGHYEPAVHEAAKAVELHTQLKVGRRDLSGKKLYSTAFAKDDPIPGGARLRFRHIDGSERPDAWTSAHEGAQHLGMGCAQGIRNPQAHPSENISEQEALEQLAALSVLARWVAECDVNHADGDAAGA